MQIFFGYIVLAAVLVITAVVLADRVGISEALVRKGPASWLADPAAAAGWCTANGPGSR